MAGGLGDMARRVKMPDGRESLNDPRVLPGVLHLYSLGYRNYMLYGVERWIAKRGNVPVFRRKISELRAEMDRLRRDRPDGWEDLSRRYEDAVDGLGELVKKSDKAEP